MTAGQRLQDEILNGIRRLLIEDGLQPGDRIVESRLAERLRISRTPVRSALDSLAEQGFIRRVRNRGVELVSLPEAPAAEPADPRENGELVLQISHDRNLGHLADEVTETELMRRYNISRNEVNRLLERLADLGVVERKLGYGWRFVDSLRDAAARLESFKFRAVIEPAGLLMPGFRLDPSWIRTMRDRHRRFSEMEWQDSHSVAFFDMNAAFHEGLAAGSGNRYILDAIQRQNQLRRLLNYDWIYGSDRVQQVCREHIAVLDNIEAGDLEMAALLLRRHIEHSIALRQNFGSKPAPEAD
ncbi:MAG TPA: FCD domain-containing protein [Rhizobiaceae bacterium]|nr:FCD domain-containing protein [Rhizobiaceae bacterium]